MERKEYGTNRRILSTVVFCHFAIVCCAGSFKVYAGAAARMKNGQAASIHGDRHNDRHNDRRNARHNARHNARAQTRPDSASRLTARVDDSESGPVQPLLKNKVTVDSAASTDVLTDVLTGGSSAPRSGANPTPVLFDSFAAGAGASAELDRRLALGELFAPDGILTGRMLLAGALTNSLMHPAELFGGSSVISQVTPDLVAKMFPGAPRGNIDRYWPLMRRALADRGLVDRVMVLMALATVRAETATFNPISEAPSPLNTQSPGHPFNKYDRRSDLGNLGPPDGAMFRGRGFIQLTGRKNYGYYGEMLGYDLMGNPDLANAPQPAAQILAAYLKENEDLIRSALMMSDFSTARKIVNGGTNGLDKFTAAFLTGNQLIRNSDGDISFSKESHRRRESRKGTEVKAAPTSASTSKGLKSKEKGGDALADRKAKAKKRDDLAEGKIKAKKRDDLAEGKTKAKKRDDPTDGKIKAKKHDDLAKGKSRAKKRDDATIAADGTDGKGKGKGFVLFRPLRLFRTISSLQ
jgi:peptidoglycan L-alanyl-D-glutamate endopeptidase CwlK